MGRIGIGVSERLQPCFIARRQAAVHGPQHHECHHVPMGHGCNAAAAMASLNVLHECQGARDNVPGLLIVVGHTAVNVALARIHDGAGMTLIPGVHFIEPLRYMHRHRATVIDDRGGRLAGAQ